MQHESIECCLKDDRELFEPILVLVRTRPFSAVVGDILDHRLLRIQGSRPRAHARPRTRRSAKDSFERSCPGPGLDAVLDETGRICRHDGQVSSNGAKGSCRTRTVSAAVTSESTGTTRRSGECDCLPCLRPCVVRHIGSVGRRRRQHSQSHLKLGDSQGWKKSAYGWRSRPIVLRTRICLPTTR